MGGERKRAASAHPVSASADSACTICLALYMHKL